MYIADIKWNEYKGRNCGGYNLLTSGGDGVYHDGLSALECRDLCAEMDACRAVTRNRHTGRCWFKSQCPNPENRDDADTSFVQKN